MDMCTLDDFCKIKQAIKDMLCLVHIFVNGYFSISSPKGVYVHILSKRKEVSNLKTRLNIYAKIYA